jgi:hypothetical protein
MPCRAQELDRAAREAYGVVRPLVVEHLDVGQTGTLVDREVHELPADPA